MAISKKKKAAKRQNNRLSKSDIFQLDMENTALTNGITASPDININKFPRSKAEFETIKDQLREYYIRRGFDDGQFSAREEAKRQQKFLPRDDQRVITLMIAIEKIAEANTQLTVTAVGLIKYMTGMDK